MEAASLKTKKKINKGKLKKTMKHVICRPDPTSWPQTSEDESKALTETLNRFKLVIPEYIKPLWKELCNIPKESRPKAPPIPKIEGLILGITACQKAIEIKKCSGVLIESAVNPKIIVQPLIDTCNDNSVPVLCLKDLRKLTKINFGIPTTVLGVKQNCLPELETKIDDIYNKRKPPKRQTVNEQTNFANQENSLSKNVTEEIMDVDIKPSCPYLYRADMKTRVFTPSQGVKATSITNKFAGQNFIKLPNNLEKQSKDSKKFMKMIVKKISSNPNRRKVTKVNSKD